MQVETRRRHGMPSMRGRFFAIRVFAGGQDQGGYRGRFRVRTFPEFLPHLSLGGGWIIDPRSRL
ncbi:MAG: hypothetical protein DMG09_11930, partial [Acidobacteria bacterium]